MEKIGEIGGSAKKLTRTIKVKGVKKPFGKTSGFSLKRTIAADISNSKARLIYPSTSRTFRILCSLSSVIESL
jgi:hypothetical protein